MIVFVHLLNDRSGSPRVLGNVMAALARMDTAQLLYLGSGGDGFLGDSVPQARRYAYRRSTNRWLTLKAYLVSQYSLWRSLQRSNDVLPNALVYVNTLLPFAAALYGRMTGRKVVCHLHEVSVRPRLLQCFLLRIACWSADRVICVSEFHRRSLGLAHARVVPNSVDPDMFVRGLRSAYVPRRNGNFLVCMLTALRDYKGVPEFIRLAQALPDVSFELIASDGPDAARRYLDGSSMPSNLRILLGVEDASDIYERASLVVNMSRVDLCQETFGLTLLEAMVFGVPVIAPPVGGPVELIEDGVNGYLIDSRNCGLMRDVVTQMACDEDLCRQLSKQCRIRAKAFSPEAFQARIVDAVFGE